MGENFLEARFKLIFYYSVRAEYFENIYIGYKKLLSDDIYSSGFMDTEMLVQKSQHQYCSILTYLHSTQGNVANAPKWNGFEFTFSDMTLSNLQWNPLLQMRNLWVINHKIDGIWEPLGSSIAYTAPEDRSIPLGIPFFAVLRHRPK